MFRTPSFEPIRVTVKSQEQPNASVQSVLLSDKPVIAKVDVECVYPDVCGLSLSTAAAATESEQHPTESFEST